ncbi:MAG: NAD(P)-dependent oxidoreductase [Pseudomonadota bacterium]
MPEWMTEAALRDALAPLLPGVEILAGQEAASDPAARARVRALAVSRLFPGAVEGLSGLQLVQKLGAGVETIVSDPALPARVRVARLKPDEAAREIAEYCLAYGLGHLRHVWAHAADQAARAWRPRAPRGGDQATVAVLGLGHIGARVATSFAGLGIRTIGWSRGPKAVAGVESRHGLDALSGVLAGADIVAAALPSTPETVDLLDAARFAVMKPGALLINAGRGDLIVERDLLAALDAGRPGAAVLDVFRQEPLPAAHPFWTHPTVMVTPHVSGWRVDGGIGTVAENYRRLLDGRPLLHEVDRATGY